MEANRVFATRRQGNGHLPAIGTDNRQQKNIVLAEPDASLALLLRDLLWQETSCDIFCVVTGEQALRLLPQVRPEFLIVNSQLADMTGGEMFEQLQNRKACISLRAISLYASSPKARTSPSLPSCLDLSFGAEYLLRAIAALVGNSPLPSAKQVSMGQRVPLTRTNVASGVSSGALLRYHFHSSSSADPLTLHRMTTQTSGPGKRSSGRIARSTRKSVTSGPLCPSNRRNRCQAEAGHCLARSSSGTFAGLLGCSRSRRGAGPLREGA